jgi:hypothetical protein
VPSTVAAGFSTTLCDLLCNHCQREFAEGEPRVHLIEPGTGGVRTLMVKSSTGEKTALIVPDTKHLALHVPVCLQVY